MASYKIQFFSDLIKAGQHVCIFEIMFFRCQNDTKDTAFSVGLQGIHANDVEKVTKIISDTFDQVIR